MQRVGFEPGTSWTPVWRPRKHDHGRFILQGEIFDEIIQFLLRSKVAKAESCLIGGYHDERIELTYYIETLYVAMEETGSLGLTSLICIRYKNCVDLLIKV